MALGQSNLSATFVHLEGYAARLALVLHLARWASGEGIDPVVCDVTSMEHGITLARWFANEARRVYSLLCETQDECDRGTLIEWLERRGGQASARDLCRANGRKFSTTDAADAALKRLADEGVGPGWTSRPGNRAGGPYRVFSLGSVTGDSSGVKTARSASTTGGLTPPRSEDTKTSLAQN